MRSKMGRNNIILPSTHAKLNVNLICFNSSFFFSAIIRVVLTVVVFGIDRMYEVLTTVYKIRK